MPRKGGSRASSISMEQDKLGCSAPLDVWGALPETLSSKMPSALLEEAATQLCASIPGEGGLYLRWIREGIFVSCF